MSDSGKSILASAKSSIVASYRFGSDEALLYVVAFIKVSYDTGPESADVAMSENPAGKVYVAL